ncbi:mRNA decay activator protein ZFP36L3-like [Melanotaenia boesemani]|uniref:mRNA decay activator protein ZFP36L3-like n=1 Tax=Melanotaenia boesemani TaxID=1250792 RepID=UPI001C044F24|nr:mRNA decay activator protein ZFP36L3-like [Melanotaenia boesemani]
MQLGLILAALLCFTTWANLVHAMHGPVQSCSCLLWSNTKVPPDRIKSYTIQKEGACTIAAVIFQTKKKKTICSDPNSSWAISVIQKVDERVQASSKKTPKEKGSDMTPTSRIARTTVMTPASGVTSGATMAPGSDMAPAATMSLTSDFAPAATMAPASGIAPASSVAPAATMAPGSDMAPAATMSLTSDFAPAATMAPGSDIAPVATMVPASSIAPVVTMTSGSAVAPAKAPKKKNISRKRRFWKKNRKMRQWQRKLC